MVSALNKSVSNGIATGIQAKPVWGSKEHKKKLTKLWTRWGKYADADGVLGWEGLQALSWREWNEAGGVRPAPLPAARGRLACAAGAADRIGAVPAALQRRGQQRKRDSTRH